MHLINCLIHSHHHQKIYREINYLLTFILVVLLNFCQKFCEIIFLISTLISRILLFKARLWKNKKFTQIEIFSSNHLLGNFFCYFHEIFDEKEWKKISVISTVSVRNSMPRMIFSSNQFRNKILWHKSQFDGSSLTSRLIWILTL